MRLWADLRSRHAGACTADLMECESSRRLSSAAALRRIEGFASLARPVCGVRRTGDGGRSDGTPRSPMRSARPSPTRTRLCPRAPRRDRTLFGRYSRSARCVRPQAERGSVVPQATGCSGLAPERLRTPRDRAEVTTHGSTADARADPEKPYAGEPASRDALNPSAECESPASLGAAVTLHYRFVEATLGRASPT
jgi:hypothetical protein